MLDWDSLYGEAGARAMTGGKKRFYDNRVHEIVTRSVGGKTTVSAVVDGDRAYRTQVQFDEQGGLYDYACDCAEDTGTEGPCRHIVATALAYESKFPAAIERGTADSVKRRSDASVRPLIEQYGNRRRGRRMAESGEKVRLIPTMEPDENGRLKLRFGIGIKKTYLLRDIADFVQCCKTGAEKRYGLELSVLHVPESFDEPSAKLCAFICGAYRERTEFYSDLGVASPDHRDRLRLGASGVDEFMRLMQGQVVACDDPRLPGGVRKIEATPNALDTGLKLERVSGGYVLQCALGGYRTVFGKSYAYLFTDSAVYPVTDEYTGAVLPLVSAIEARGRLFVADADMSQFYNSVLARVLAFTEIDAGDVCLSEFEAEPLELKVYVDAVPGGGVLARVCATYDGENDVDIFDEYAQSPFVRDYEAENAFTEVLKKYFPYYPALVVTDEADIYVLLRDGLRELMGSAEVFLAEEIRRMKVKKPPRVKVGVRLKSDLLDLDLSAEGYTAEQLREILDAYRNNRSYVRLTDGSFVDLLDPSLAALSAVAAVAKPQGETLSLPLYYAPYVDEELKSGFFQLERSDDFKKLVKEVETTADETVPASLAPVLRNYQKTGYRWLKTLSRLGFGGILADDMGLGKSLQVIALLLGDRGGTSVIVCPTTLVLNWVNELRKFAPELKVLAVTGSGEARKSLRDEFPAADVVITSYELLRRDAALYEGFAFTYAVIDEAQYIKNPDTKNARAVKKLCAAHRFALTGTPVENSLAELWSIFDFLMPGYLFTYPKFRDTLENGIVHGNDAAAGQLSRLIRPFVLRRLKTEVLKELPPKVESNVLCPLEDEQRDVYIANLGSIKESVLGGETVNKVAVLSMLTKLRQICCEPRLVYADYAGNSSKRSACIELIRTAIGAGHKVLVFSQFTSMLEILRVQLAQEGVSHFLLKGDTPKVERMKLVARFNADDTSVFLISLKAGGTGLNLTGADVVIHYDPWWNESVMNQATDRAYRIGQDKSVQVYKLIVENSIEQRIMQLQERKAALSDIVSAAASAKGLSTQEILELLG